MNTQDDYIDLLNITSQFANMGSWKVDLIEDKLYWCPITKKIHEVSHDFKCSIQQALNFYKDPVSKKATSIAYQRAIKKHQEYDIKVKITTAKNKEKWVRSIGIPVISEGKCIKVYGVFQDITEQETQYQELKRQMSLLNDMFLNSHMGVSFADLDGNLFKANRGLCNIFGYEEKEMLTKSFQDLTHPEDLDFSLTYIQQLIDGEKTYHTTEKRYKHKSGKTIYGFLYLSMIKDSFGKPLHFMSQIIDLTQQYETNKKLKSYLNVTTDQNKRLLNFAHIVSHNLRSHSSNLKMLLNLLKIENPELEDNEVIAMVNQSVNNLSETILHLNEVVMIQTSDRKNVRNLNLKEYIVNTIETLSAIIKENDCEIIDTIEEDLAVNFVPAYLESILLNLISNSIKYKSKERRLKLNLFVKKKKKYLILYVQDNGLGINLEDHKKSLFGMYKTFHNHEDSRGIGLFITKNQIEAMGGKIEVESQVDKGSTFKVYFKNEA
ncbi:MAG: histidine kinase [Flavobacteriaceae bacterium]|nr:histidine kinase [Flavobacteriaceae bacterium]